MPASRSPLAFMRRTGMVETPPVPGPRLDTGAPSVLRLPLRREQLSPPLLLDAAGDPPPDRGVTGEWPPQQEVVGDGSFLSDSA